MNQEILVISGQEYTVKIYIERRRTSLCSIGKNINIRIPTFLSSKDQLSEIERLKTWAIKKIQDNPPISKTIKEYNSGDILTIGEKKYTLVITTGDIERSRGRLRDDNIILTLPRAGFGHAQKTHFLASQKQGFYELAPKSDRNRQEEISKLINKIISRERLPVLEKKIRELNSQYFKDSLDIGVIKFKNQKTRWGSCSQKKNINISVRLLLAPEHILEYVCLHELAHLREHNHSAKFWSIIQSIDPSYKDKHKWLRRHGKELII